MHFKKLRSGQPLKVARVVGSGERAEWREEEKPMLSAESTAPENLIHFPNFL